MTSKYHSSEYENNQEVQALVEQLQKTELDIELAIKNREMFYRLWIKWSQEEDLKKEKQSRLRAILRNKLETTP